MAQRRSCPARHAGSAWVAAAADHTRRRAGAGSRTDRPPGRCPAGAPRPRGAACPPRPGPADRADGHRAVGPGDPAGPPRERCAAARAAASAASGGLRGAGVASRCPGALAPREPGASGSVGGDGGGADAPRAPHGGGVRRGAHRAGTAARLRVSAPGCGCPPRHRPAGGAGADDRRRPRAGPPQGRGHGTPGPRAQGERRGAGLALRLSRVATARGPGRGEGRCRGPPRAPRSQRGGGAAAPRAGGERASGPPPSAGWPVARAPRRRGRPPGERWSGDAARRRARARTCCRTRGGPVPGAEPPRAGRRGPWAGVRCRSPRPRARSTTTASESWNEARRQGVQGRRAFPHAASRRTGLSMGLQQVAQKWTQPMPAWKAALNQCVMLGGERVQG